MSDTVTCQAPPFLLFPDLFLLMSDQDPAAPVTPLDQAPLAEFVARRDKGESGETPAPAPEPSKTPETPKPPDPGDEPPDEEPAEPADPGKPPSGGKKDFKSRFDQIYRQRSDALREVEAHKAKIAALEAEIQQARAPKPPAEPVAQPALDPGKAPVLEEWLGAGKTYEDWLDARNDWRIQKALQSERQRVAAEASEREVQAQMAGFVERTEAARTKYSDYDEKVVQNDRVQLSPVMMDIARRSPAGPDLMYWLATHEDQANQIGELTKFYPPASYPLVEAHLLLLSGHQTSAPGAKKAVSVSQAPAPISPVGGGSTTSTVPLDQAPLGEFVKRRNAEIQKRRTG